MTSLPGTCIWSVLLIDKLMVKYQLQFVNKGYGKSVINTEQNAMLIRNVQDLFIILQ